MTRRSRFPTKASIPNLSDGSLSYGDRNESLFRHLQAELRLMCRPWSRQGNVTVTRSLAATYHTMNEQSLAVASASSLCLFPWSSQIAEPLIISLSGSCNGSVAASPDFVFITTSPSEIQFFDPRDPELSKLVEANPSSSSDTPIKALLCRSNTGLLFVRGSKIYCRTMDSSRIRHITRVSIVFMAYVLCAISMFCVWVVARTPKGQFIVWL